MIRPIRATHRPPRFICRTVQALYCVLLAACSIRAQGFRHEILVESGLSGLVSIDNQVAINDTGTVAFTGAELGGSGGFITNGGNTYQRITFAPTSSRRYNGVGISNATPPLVALRDLFSGPSYRIRTWTPGGTNTILGRSGAGQDFDSASFNLDINDSGVVAFSGLVSGSTVLFSAAGSAPLIRLATYSTATSLRPQISDRNDIVIQDTSNRIIVYEHPTGNVDVVAGLAWNATGREPGISADGSTVAFIGEQSPGSGEHVYVSYSLAGQRIVEQVTQSGFFTDLDGNQRVAVASEGTADTEQRIELVYVATRDEGGFPVSSIYAQRVDVTTTAANGTVFHAGDPRKVVGAQDVLNGKTVTSFRVYHPINQTHDIGLWARFADNSTAIVRSVPITVHDDFPNGRIGTDSARIRTSTSGADLDIEVEVNEELPAGGTSNPSDYRRWWHFQVDGLDMAGSTLNVKVKSAGYGDVIIPVMSESLNGGATWGSYSRLNPSLAQYSVAQVPPGSNLYEHTFRVHVPASVTSVRMAKYFPYTVAEKDAFIASVQADPRVQVDRKLQGMQHPHEIQMITVTDPHPNSTVAGKRRVWVHSGVHTAETTSYFVVEGLVAELLSGSAEMNALLRSAIFNIIPMVNASGVDEGFYRLNSANINLENEWGGNGMGGTRSPETNAMRQWIEQFMGTPLDPGEAPIEVMLNLHSSHNVTTPIHFPHCRNDVPNPHTFAGAGPCTCGQTLCPGVTSAVRTLEDRWVREFDAASSFVGSVTALSKASPSVIERWMFSNYSDHASGAWRPVMAITFEGNYGDGPTQGILNTPSDWRQVGHDMAHAIARYLDNASREYGPACNGTVLTGDTGVNTIDLLLASPAPNSNVALLFGPLRLVPGFPIPVAPRCELLITAPADSVSVGVTDMLGGMALSNLPIPNALVTNLQAIVLGPNAALHTSNGLSLYYR